MQGPMIGELSATDLSLTVTRILKKGAVASSMPRRHFSMPKHVQPWLQQRWDIGSPALNYRIPFGLPHTG
jgi:hypothetical protein